jgi:catechol 2,3-dioxygenase-like lactoylglutathione lyase family enzyme
MATRLDAVHPVLMCGDVAVSIGFYERLGFAVVFRDRTGDTRYAAIARDGVELHLQWHDASQWAYPTDRPVYRFLVGDVDALYSELQRNGAMDARVGVGSPWRAPADTPWNTREFHLRDPDGNGLQFYRPT